MRILILGHREIASNLAISLLVGDLRQHDLRIALSGAGDAHGSHPVAELTHLDRAEQDMCDALDEGYVNGQPIPNGFHGFEGLARLTGKPLEILPSPNSPPGLAALANWAPDLILSIRYRRILHDAAIAIPAHGILNLHSGLLPEFRGVMATFHSMLAGNRNIGSTLHWIQDCGIDTGAIISTSPVLADYSATYLDNVLRLYPSGCAMMVDAVSSLASGNSLKSKEPGGPGAYFHVPTLAQCHGLRDMGLKLCDGGELARFLTDFTKEPARHSTRESLN